MTAPAGTIDHSTRGGVSLRPGDGVIHSWLNRLLLRLGLLAEGYIYPREERGARDLARKRMQLARIRARKAGRRRPPAALPSSTTW